ncbi:TetR/AcrR family transcriptional regulator C-terminal domain-containing protein [Leifsonia sp. F6_8S_P_1B]|uniref:TetR/AcrR family transcriptional regulator C-terminal domain-containing protein n=1 Tax=Leifsonia williamsii TaxID=3035919 RepID=A0ABT8K8H5_9MICO|nr:TetR/AcrR family transcriptional regulator C-terminal domain-containing protein [Leifsonia williamsii]MDN4613111.1 TetR/AcrR family transcriptional regulator C-terminal domain-containing protein [Leifsonia williamsii]
MPERKPTGGTSRSARRVGRPTTTVLTRDLIAHAALRLLDEGGQEGFTMARLAQALRVRPSALYNHVDGKDDVIAAVRELVSDRIDVSAFATEPWDAAMLHWAHSYRVAFAAHPPTIAMLATMPLTGARRTMRMYDTVVAAMVAGGWPEAEVLPAIVAVESFILGSALDAIAPGDMFDPAGEEEAVPAFAAAYAARARAIGDAPPADGAFEAGLEAMVAGLRVRFAELAPGRATR